MQNQSSETRTCRKCGESKPLDIFGRHRWGCRACMAADQRERRRQYAMDHAGEPPPIWIPVDATCGRCGIAKSAAEFSTHWRNTIWCKRCYADAEMARNRRRGMRPARRVELAADGRRPCSSCGALKSRIEFPKTRPGVTKHPPYCKRCVADRMSLWRAANPARARSAVKAAWERNGETYRKRRTASDIANRESILIKQRVWTRANRARVAARKAISYALNPIPTRQRAARWAKANPDKTHLYSSLRRARKYNLDTEPFTAIDWADLQELFGHRCAYCWKRPARLHQDHVDPLVRGGVHGPSNIVPACPSCNSHKQRKNLLEFLSYRGQLIDSRVSSLACL